MRFLFVDRILELQEGKLVRGIKHITADDSFLEMTSTSTPCFTPSLLGETLGQLAAWNVMKTQHFKARPVAGILARAAIYRPAFVGETVALESIIEHLDDAAVEYHSTARIGNEVIFTLEGALGPMLPMETFIDEHTVKRQFDQIYRPGAWPPAPAPRHDLNLGSSPLAGSTLHLFNFDRIISIEPGLSIQAEKRINLAAPYFPDHFPYQPVLPLTVLLECKHNLAKAFLAASNIRGYRLFELKKIKMKEFVHPGDVITSSLSIKQHDPNALTLALHTEREGKRICTADMTFIPETTTPCNQDA